MGQRKRYDKEFQLEAARLVIEQGYSKTEVGRKLGVAAWSVKKWIDRFLENGVLVADGKVTAEADELRMLRKQIVQLKVEVELLKKTAARRRRRDCSFGASRRSRCEIRLGEKPMRPISRLRFVSCLGRQPKRLLRLAKTLTRSAGEKT